MNDILDSWGKNPRKCECDLCVRSRSFEEHLTRIPESERDYFEALYECLLNTEQDLEYENAIKDGTWPQAVEILEKRLENAKQVQASEEAQNNG